MSGALRTTEDGHLPRPPPRSLNACDRGSYGGRGYEVMACRVRIIENLSFNLDDQPCRQLSFAELVSLV